MCTCGGERTLLQSALSSTFHGLQQWNSGQQTRTTRLQAISEAGELGVFKKMIYKIDWKYTTLKENLTRVKASPLKTIERA